MVDWRHMGEIPDSEDEDGFESQATDHSQNQSNGFQIKQDVVSTPQPQPVKSAVEKDIWDIPSSPDHLDKTATTSLEVTSPKPPGSASSDSPLSSPCTDRSSPDLPSVAELLNQPAVPHDEQSLRLRSPSEVPRLQTASSSAMLDWNMQTVDLEPTLSSRGLSQVPPQPGQSHQHDELDAEAQEARLLVARNERSLRTRKPEQLRPYFTENMRYAREWRQHGLNPLRLVNNEIERAHGPQSGPEDRESQFAGHDASQQATTDDTDDSQRTLLAVVQDDLLIREESSSPMRTSPLHLQGVISSQASSRAETEGTSLDDDELPTLQQLVSRRTPRSGLKPRRRQTSPDRPSTAKRRRLTTAMHSHTPSRVAEAQAPAATQSSSQTDVFKLPDAVPGDEEYSTRGLDDEIEQGEVAPGETAHLLPQNRQSPGNAAQARQPSPIILDDDASSATEGSSDSDVQVVDQHVRRIRGVLPASWLRLDQLSGRAKIQKSLAQRQVNRPPERENRRGVAHRRTVQPGSVRDQLLFEDSDDDDSQPPAPETTEDLFPHQTRLALGSRPNPPEARDFHIDSDASSDMEDNTVDHMVLGSKRQSRLSDQFQKPTKIAKRSNTSAPKKRSTPRQPRIDAVYSKSKTPSESLTERSRSKPQKPRRRRAKAGPRLNTSQPSLPQLSILDVIEPDAPQFLKIAARTAKKRSDQGRADQRGKSIQMATRCDQLDALELLTDWRRGSIKQRGSVTAKRRTSVRKHEHRALGDTARSERERPSSSSTGNVNSKTDRSKRRHHSPDTPSRLRPAQLESNEAGMSAVAFHASKKILDQLYHAKRLDQPASTGTLRRYSFQPPPDRTEEDDALPRSPRPQYQRRRKQKPQQINVDDPQFTHARDPVIQDYDHTDLSISEGPNVNSAEDVVKLDVTNKLSGLGPYGTAYTHHFECLPLPSGVYFGHSTLLGKAVIETVVESNFLPKLKLHKPRTFFSIGPQTLRWGLWDAQVSSEMGIVFDHIAEYLEGDQCLESTSVDAAHFLVSYVSNFMTLETDTETFAAVTRMLELLEGFSTKVDVIAKSQGYRQKIFRVMDCLCLVAFVVYLMCRGDPNLVGYQVTAEERLKAVASALSRVLGTSSIKNLRHRYRALQVTRHGAQEFQDDACDAHSWVLLMRILFHANIPRSTFWDIVSHNVVGSAITSTNDARILEGAWETLFTLLPLTEFNDRGILVAGQRRKSNTDGWTIPQKLLRRVFELYKSQAKQAPSFNSYCRAILARCHHLISEWGWVRCVTIIGPIFDFFGSQSLAHLRNEQCYGSPKFLENLAQTPNVAEVEPEDQCFHIFLKMLALSICRLRAGEHTKEIRNMVARTVPNHNRQYMKEHHIHEHDLAALRNHHDLLCTLYWAAPPAVRPSVALIERLVHPESSHKEACLISLRAWSQLARFVVSNGEATTSMKPFNQWRDRFFTQMMQQYDTIASDIQQQFLGLSSDVSKSVSPDMISAMVKLNKTAVADVVHVSLSTSLDVMKHTQNLEAATFALNTQQLQRILQHFSSPRPEFDWSMLRTALLTLDVFLSRVDDFKDAEESQQTESQLLNSAQADDALLSLDHDLASNFFQMARRVLVLNPDTEQSCLASVDMVACIEHVVKLGARMGMRFINAGVMTFDSMFKPGKHRLFQDRPHLLGFNQRRYLTLLVETLVELGFDGFCEDGLSLCELWVLAIVKPSEALAYENRLAQRLIRQGEPFVPEAAQGLSISPGYRTNRDMFEFAISWMRKSIRDAGPSQKRALQAEHSRILKLAMEQMRRDLGSMQGDSSQHRDYIKFVRECIELIKAHGTDICTVDDFFYQISKDYSPSEHDPQLQVAAIVSYGLRLAEGESRAAHELFYFLVNNFKVALMKGDLAKEVDMIAKGMRHPGISRFVVGAMLPAILQAAFVESRAYPMLDVYAHSICQYLNEEPVPRVLDETHLPQIRALVQAIVEASPGSQTTERLHVWNQSLSVLNLLWPTFKMFSLGKVRSAEWGSTCTLLETMQTNLREADFTAGVLEGHGPREHLADAGPARSLISSFTTSIIDDVRGSWVVSSDNMLMIQAPSRGTQTQSGIGVRQATLVGNEVAEILRETAKNWKHEWQDIFGDTRRRRTRAFEVPLF